MVGRARGRRGEARFLQTDRDAKELLMLRIRRVPAVLAALLALVATAPLAALPPDPADVSAVDRPGDGGAAVFVRWRVPAPAETARAIIERSRTASEATRDGAADTPWILVAEVAALEGEGDGYLVSGLPNSKDDRHASDEIVFRVAFIGVDGERTPAVEAAPVVARANAFLLDKIPLALVCVIVSASVLAWILLSRAGWSVKIRRIAALEAIDEAVGRATEMGRSVLFVPGIQDMNDIQTVAGVTILGRVAKTAAEYDAKLEVPTARSIVMTAARETVQSSHFAAGRPETYDESSIRYITDEQFGYVAYVAGRMVREKPAACFYMGAFYAESLVLAENGNAIGAIQVAGTAEASQLPFFVAACDYTLIGEEFYAASAYLSGERDQLGSIKGQDLGKLFAAGAIIVGAILATLASLSPSGPLAGASTAFRAFFGG